MHTPYFSESSGTYIARRPKVSVPGTKWEFYPYKSSNVCSIFWSSAMIPFVGRKSKNLFIMGKFGFYYSMALGPVAFGVNSL